MLTYMISFFPAREIVLEIGSFDIHWYGLLWAASFWVVWYMADQLQWHRDVKKSSDAWVHLVAIAALGAIVGGRLGYVLIYEPAYFLQHPFDIFAIWQGGMASHGGFIGVGVAVWLVSKTWKNVRFLSVMDILVVPISLALAMGRIGNWINLEIFGNNPIAIGKNLGIAGICYLLLRSNKYTQPGIVTAVFLLAYGGLRYLIEPLRDDPWGQVWGLTYGQLLTLPLLLTGVLLLVWLRKQRNNLNKPTSS